MIGHELTAFYGLDHAQSLAVVQPQLLRVTKEDKNEKLAQMGKNVFGVSGDEVINEIEKMYKKISISTNLNDYDIDDKVVETIIPSLKKHGMTTLGENGKITLDVSSKILEMTMKTK